MSCDSQVHVLVALRREVKHHHLWMARFEGTAREEERSQRRLTPVGGRKGRRGRGLLLLLALDGSVDHEVGEVDVAFGLLSLQCRRGQITLLKSRCWLCGTSWLRPQHSTTLSFCAGFFFFPIEMEARRSQPRTPRA